MKLNNKFTQTYLDLKMFGMKITELGRKGQNMKLRSCALLVMTFRIKGRHVLAPFCSAKD